VLPAGRYQDHRAGTQPLQSKKIELYSTKFTPIKHDNNNNKQRLNAAARD
jgi:hypothetical protein